MKRRKIYSQLLKGNLKKGRDGYDIDSSFNNNWDLWVELEPEIYDILGETLNDIALEDLNTIYENYCYYFELGFRNRNYESDHDFWLGWCKKMDENGIDVVY